MDEANKFSMLAYKGAEDATFSFGLEALFDINLDNKIDKRMIKYEERIVSLEEKFSNLLEKDRVAIPEKQGISEISIEPISFDKLEDAINSMENNDDIRLQIQCVTRVINQLDILRKSSIFDENRRKIITFLRTVMKINCDRKIFNEEQLLELKKILMLLRNKDVEFKNLIIIEKNLRKSGLRTMVPWE